MPDASKQHNRPAIGTAHKRSTSHRPREQRQHAAARGYDHRWAKFRRAFLSANPLCEYCLAQGRTEAAVICDHDLPHDHDTHLFWDNTFTALCKRHHDSDKQRMERRYKGDDLLRHIRLAKGAM